MDTLTEKIKKALDRECVDRQDFSERFWWQFQCRGICLVCDVNEKAARNVAKLVADALRDDMPSPSQKLAALKG